MNNRISHKFEGNTAFVIETIILALALLFFIILTRADIITASSQQWLTDGAWTIFALLASLRCFQAAERQVDGLRKGWLLLCYAHLAWFIGILIWSYLELIAKQATPFPAYSDIGFMLFAPLFTLGLFYFREPETYSGSKLVQFSKLMVIIASLVLVHIYLLMERFIENSDDWLYNSAAMIYPVLYMAALVYALLTFTQLNKLIPVKHFMLIFAGLLTHAITVSLYAYSLLGHEYEVGHYLDVFWLLGFGLIYLAATQAQQRYRTAINRREFVLVKYLNSLMVPIFLIIIMIVILSNVDAFQAQQSDTYLYALALLLVTMVLYLVSIARLERTLLENLSSSELLLEKSHNELLQLTEQSGEKLAEEIKRRQQADAALKQHHDLLETIKQVQDQFISGIDRYKFFEVLLDRTLSITGSEYGFIGEILTKQGGALYLKSAALTNIAWNEETRRLYKKSLAEGMVFDNLDTLFGYCIRHKQVVISNDPAHDPRRGGLPDGHPALDSFLGIPLMKGDNMIGMIGLANRQDGYNEQLVELWQPLFRTCANLVLATKVENDRKLAEQHLLLAKNEAEIANQAKSDFMSRMSHELRTPLNAVIGFAQLLELEESLSPEHKDSISEIHKAGLHLMELINDLLDLSRIETDKLQYSFSDVSIKRIIEDSMQFAAKMAKDNHISIELHSGDDCIVYGDEVRLKQVFTNLLTNAIKYNRKHGRVEVRIHTSDDKKYCRVSVQDSGIGIAAEKISRIFTPFDRLEVEKYAVDGVGIGLYISKSIIDKHKGDITVTSQEGHGTTFEVKLPLSQ